MQSKILFGLGALVLISATVMLVVHKYEEMHPHVVPIRPTRDDLSTCTVQKCFHSLWECQNDANCILEATQVNQKYMDHPKKFSHIFENVQSSILKEHIECQKECGVFDYLKRCAAEDVYIKKCLMEVNSKCQTENKDYFDNFKECTARQYKACDNITDKEAYTKCYSQELIWCASDGLGQFKGHFDHAMYCV